MVILIREAVVRAVTFLGFGSQYRSRQGWFRLDGIGWCSRVDDDLRGLTREDLLELILKPFLDKSWDPCTGVVNVSEIKMMGVRDHGIKGVLHIVKG